MAEMSGASQAFTCGEVEGVGRGTSADGRMRIEGIGLLIGKGKFCGRGVSEAKAEDEKDIEPSNQKEGEGEAF